MYLTIQEEFLFYYKKYINGAWNEFRTIGYYCSSWIINGIQIESKTFNVIGWREIPEYGDRI